MLLQEGLSCSRVYEIEARSNGSCVNGDRSRIASISTDRRMQPLRLPQSLGWHQAMRHAIIINLFGLTEDKS